MHGRRGIGVGCVVVMLVAIQAQEADAQCTLGTCSSTYCEIDCPTSSDLIVFGTLYKNGSATSVGVCRFTTGGSFLDVTETGRVSDDYRLRADGNSGVSGGNDMVRLARPGSAETCGSYGGATWTIKGELPPNSAYLFWGDLGDDTIYLCDRLNPSASDCIGNAGRADGRGGADYLYGSVHDDSLWGGNGSDHIYGRAGDDYIYGGGDQDFLWGGPDDDIVSGDGGDYDEGYGEDGCDVVDGGAGTGDVCDCGSGGHGIAWQYCESVSNCGGCY